MHVLFADDLVDLGAVADHVDGLDELRAAATDSRPSASRSTPVSTRTRSAASRTSSRARRPRRCTRRIGTCTQEFGTLASWLVDVLNVLTGNLDRPGGAMFAKPAAGGANTGGKPGVGRGVRFGRRHVARARPARVLR